jgi:hypothetical protein
VETTGSRGTPAEEKRKESKGNNGTEGNVSKEIQARTAMGMTQESKETKETRRREEVAVEQMEKNL